MQRRPRKPCAQSTRQSACFGASWCTACRPTDRGSTGPCSSERRCGTSSRCWSQSRRTRGRLARSRTRAWCRRSSRQRSGAAPAGWRAAWQRCQRSSSCSARRRARHCCTAGAPPSFGSSSPVGESQRGGGFTATNSGRINPRGLVLLVIVPEGEQTAEPPIYARHRRLWPATATECKRK